jgi:hypothetical protein
LEDSPDSADQGLCRLAAFVDWTSGFGAHDDSQKSITLPLLLMCVLFGHPGASSRRCEGQSPSRSQLSSDDLRPSQRRPSPEASPSKLRHGPQRSTPWGIPLGASGNTKHGRRATGRAFANYSISKLRSRDQRKKPIGSTKVDGPTNCPPPRQILALLPEASPPRKRLYA